MTSIPTWLVLSQYQSRHKPPATRLPSPPSDHTTDPVLPRLLPGNVSLLKQDDPAVLQSVPPDQVTSQQVLQTDQDNSIVPAHQLGPDALPFVSASQEPSQRKTKTKQKKGTIQTDPVSIELEFAKVKVTTLQAKLKKQATELRDLRFRNSILMERNESLEESKKKEIHEFTSLTQPILRLLVSAPAIATSNYSPAVLSQLFITIMGNLLPTLPV
jgi:hypothetical protein